jgi:methionine-rich copper-binding protein CopC
MRSRSLIALVVAMTVVLIPGAEAHSRLVNSSPSKGSTVSTSPQSVWIEFNENLLQLDEKKINALTVTDSKGRRVDILKTMIAGARITTKIKGVLKKGKYQVKYRVVSEDGHPVQGSYFFSVK